MKSPKQQVENKMPAGSALTNELIIQAMARVDCSALGIAVGILFGAGIFSTTNFLVLTEDNLISPFFALLNQYFWGYAVTFAGSFVGLFYGFAAGFMLGWLIAFLRNFAIRIYLHVAKFKARMVSVNNFIDYP